MCTLLVEDDLTAAWGISLTLKSSGAVVDHTDSGEKALELTRHYEYDIVLLDIMLPDMEGYEVVRRMRLACNDTPVLILSGLSRPQAKVKGLGMGADDYITRATPNHYRAKAGPWARWYNSAQGGRRRL